MKSLVIDSLLLELFEGSKEDPIIINGNNQGNVFVFCYFGKKKL
jgi:hypothetical protein